MIDSLVLAASLALSVVFQKEPAALTGLDPVELCEGRETPGKEEIDDVHGNYRYLFATEESRARFRGDAARFRIQMGGGCARMGPLSGSGSPRRFAVYDGRLYIFASDACRKGFLANPEAHLERDDPLPRGSEAEIEKGREILRRAVAAAGGDGAIDGVEGYRENRRRTVKSEGVEHVNEEILILAFPDKVRAESIWDGRAYAYVANGERGRIATPDATSTMDESQVAALRRAASHHPLSILRARNRPDFVAVAEGTATVDGVALEKVAVAFDGVTTTLGVDAATGRIVKAWYRGRPGAGALASLEVAYSDFRPCAAEGGRPSDALTLPLTRVVTNAGKTVDSMSGTVEVEVNPKLDPALFAP